MPKVRLTADDRRNEIFKKQHKIDKVFLEKHDYDFARELGITNSTLSYKVKNPVGRMTLREFLHLTATWSDEKIIEFMRGR